jgi:hypothetical protein
LLMSVCGAMTPPRNLLAQISTLPQGEGDF